MHEEKEISAVLRRRQVPGVTEVIADE